MTKRASVVERALARKRVGHVALSFGMLAALSAAMAVPRLGCILLGACVVVIIGGAAWDAIVLVGLGIDAVRQRRGQRPIWVGLDYGAGEDTWFETLPGPEPYRSCDERRLLARGEPAPAARIVGRAIATRLCVVLGGVALITAGVCMVNRPRCHNCSGRVRTACSTVRQATMQWRAVNLAGGCPTVAGLKAKHDLDESFDLRDPWGGHYEIRCVDNDVFGASSGPDRKWGTADDIVVPRSDTDATVPGAAPVP